MIWSLCLPSKKGQFDCVIFDCLNKNWEGICVSNICHSHICHACSSASGKLFHPTSMSFIYLLALTSWESSLGLSPWVPQSAFIFPCKVNKNEWNFFVCLFVF
jgi:hypothetical protein